MVVVDAQFLGKEKIMSSQSQTVAATNDNDINSVAIKKPWKLNKVVATYEAAVTRTVTIDVVSAVGHPNRSLGTIVLTAAASGEFIPTAPVEEFRGDDTLTVQAPADGAQGSTLEVNRDIL